VSRRPISILRALFLAHGADRDVPYHPPTDPGHQTLLITNEDIGAKGWGWLGCCMVSSDALKTMAATQPTLRSTSGSTPSTAMR
jgi:hypothetical protein